jgi:hypothetical protein
MKFSGLCAHVATSLLAVSEIIIFAGVNSRRKIAADRRKSTTKTNNLNVPRFSLENLINQRVAQTDT